MSGRHPSHGDSVAFPFISVLPIDTLEQIFLHCSSDKDEQAASQPQTSLCISQVCRFWRATAMDCGRLWTTIDLANPQLAQHYLRHSKQANITVEWTRPSLHAKVPNYASFLRPHASRIVRIELDQDIGEINSFFSSVGRSFPSLEVLHLRSTRGTLRSASILYLGLCAPRLRKLTLLYVILAAGPTVSSVEHPVSSQKRQCHCYRFERSSTYNRGSRSSQTKCRWAQVVFGVLLHGIRFY